MQSVSVISAVSLILSLMAPFVVWVIELVLPYPYVVEELVKSVIAYTIVAIPRGVVKLRFALLSGVFFAVSETILNAQSLLSRDSLVPLATRFVLTATLHAMTLVVMVVSMYRSRKWLPVGLLLAMVMHYIYNVIASTIWF